MTRHAMEIRDIQPSEREAARQLLLQNGWERGVSEPADFNQLLDKSHIALVAVEGGRVIGFLRAFSDGLVNGYVSALVVDKDHRRRGVGRALMQSVIIKEPRVSWVLRAAREGTGDFYESIGFRRSTVAMELRGEGLSDT